MIRKPSKPILLAFYIGAGLSMSACALTPQRVVPAAQAITRYKIPGSNFPIALGVEVPAGNNIIFLSGMTGGVVDPKAPKNSYRAYGNTTEQTLGALTKIQESLERMGLNMGDIVKLRVFMVADPSHGGKLDFGGMMAGYTQFFGTRAQPHLPARSAVQVAGLAGPGRLIEIEATAVRP